MSDRLHQCGRTRIPNPEHFTRRPDAIYFSQIRVVADLAR